MVAEKEIPKGFQKTEVGIIPSDWEVRTLGDLIDSKRIIRYGIVQPGQFSNNGSLMLRSQDYSKGWVDPSTMHRINERLSVQYKNARLQYRDLVMTIVGANTGQVVEVPTWLDGAYLSRSTARITFSEEKVSVVGLIKYYLQSQSGKLQVLNYLKEGAQPVLSCTDLSKFQIPLPPTNAEQTAIATALNDADKLITELENLIAKKEMINQGVIEELLKPKKGWVEKKISEIAQLYQPETISQEKFTTEGYLVYGANGIIGRYSRYNHKEWQTIITCRGSTCGTINKTQVKCWITGNAMVANVDKNDNISKLFFYYLLLKQDFSNCITGSGQPQIVRKPIAEYLVHFPNKKSEQERIANLLADLECEIKFLEKKLNKYKMIKQGMMQNLLTGKIRLV